LSPKKDLKKMLNQSISISKKKKEGNLGLFKFSLKNMHKNLNEAWSKI